MLYKIFSLFLLVVILLPMGSHCVEANTSPVGMMTLGAVGFNGERLELAVWFPSLGGANQQKIEVWENIGARTSRVAPGFYPVIFISHDNASGRFYHHDIATSLASKGFIVVAPTHRGDSQNDLNHLFSVSSFTDRPIDILWGLELLLSNPDISPYADESRIGLLGVGFGAITVMQLLGISPDLSHLISYCKNSESDAFCEQWVYSRLIQSYSDFLLLKKNNSTETSFPLDYLAPVSRDLFTSSFLSEYWTPYVPQILQKSVGNEYRTFLLTNSSDSTTKQANLVLAGEKFSAFFGTKYDKSFRRPTELRKILSVAFLVPAGSLFFQDVYQNDTKLQDIDFALVSVKDDILYPPAAHAEWYKSLVKNPKNILGLEGNDHFSVFASCEQNHTTLEYFMCDSHPAEDKAKVIELRDTFLYSFFVDSLGKAKDLPPISFLYVKEVQESGE